MAINKVEANGETLIDLTNDTATANDVLEGQTFHLRSGAIATGTYKPSAEIEARLRATVGHSSKNLLDLTKYSASTNVTNIVVNPETGSVSANASGTYKSIYFVDENIHFENGKTYVISCTNNSTSSQGRLVIRKRVTNAVFVSTSLSTIGEKSITFTPNEVDFPDGWTITLFITGSSSSASTIDISELMMKEVSISDDTFEPYVTPTDEKKQDKPVELDPTVLTWNIADLQSKYTHIQIVCECISTSSTPDMDIYDVITIPTIIFGRTANSEKYIAFASGTSFSGVDGVYFTEANGNVTADITSSTGHGTRNIIQIIGIPK